MAVHSIHHVSLAIVKTLEIGLEGFFTSGEVGRNVYPDPPSKNKPNDGIGFYMFHVEENEAHKNFPTPGKDQAGNRYIPLSLNLYFQLTANYNDNQDVGYQAFEEQRMMSAAMKILHDFPEINDNTEIGISSQNVFEEVDDAITPHKLKDRNNRFKISLVPISHREAFSYWTADETAMKLSAYYEVTNVFLEPEPQPLYTAQVLLYGNFIFTEGKPRINLSQNILSFTLPDGTSRTVTLQPAKAPYGENIVFYGTGFAGDDLKMYLNSPDLDNPAELTAAWNLSRTADNQVSITVQQQAQLKGGTTTVDILPGVYSAQLDIIRNRTLPNGTVRSFNNTSNNSPITILPSVTNVTQPNGSGVMTITGTVFQVMVSTTDILAKKIRVFVDDQEFTRATSLAGGNFVVNSTTEIELQLVSVPTAGTILTIRVLVNDVEAPPYWVTV